MKIHIVDSPIPLAGGYETVVDCGDTVKKAYICFMWDGQAMLHSLDVSSVRNLCPKCMAKPVAKFTLADEPRYIYGVCEHRDFVEAMRDEDAKALEGAE